MPSGASLCLEHDGFRVRVRGPARAELAWLAEFLAPWFVTARGRGGDAVVTLGRRAGGLEARPTAWPGPRPTASLDVFMLDSRVVRHPVWRERGAERLVRDEELGVLYRISRRHPHVRVLAGADRVAARVALMRVVRELAMLHAQRTGRLLLHAAALAVDGRGILLVGPKLAGKTTQLLHLLRAPGAGLVANDRVAVDLGGAAPHVTGLPSIVALRPGTLALFPGLAERIATRGHAFWRTLAEARPASPPAASADLTPAQLCEVLGVRAIAGAPLGALLFPRRAATARGVEVERLPPAAVAARLRAGLFGGAAAGRASAAFGGRAAGAVRPAGALAADCAALAARVPGFACRLGEDAYADPATAARLVARVSGPG